MSNLKATIEKEVEVAKKELAEAQKAAEALALKVIDSDVNVGKLTYSLQCIESALAAICGTIPEKPTSDPSMEEMSDDLVDGEDFEAEMSRRRNQAKKAKRESGPYAGFTCNNCGEVGSLFDTTQSVRGKPVKIIACDSCTSVKYQ